MRIGIDARFYNESGVGRYLRNLISNLQVLDHKNEYFIFLLLKDLDHFKESKNFRKVEANFAWYGFAEQFKFPKLLKKCDLDLVHIPHFNVPVFYTGKFVVTIHDLIHQHHQMKRATTLDPFTYKIKQIGYSKVFKTAVTRSKKILVPSNFIKKLLTKEWNVATEKVIVTPEAVDDSMLSIEKKMSKEKALKRISKLNIKQPYIFYVGNAHPHKNVEGLISSFLNLKKKYSNLKLVLSGYDHYFWEKIKKRFQDPAIIYTGFISDEELVALYKGAESFILPSLEEGFGIPILEAMACSCPVVSSNSGSLKEVGGDGVVYFDANNIGTMFLKIKDVLDSPKLRNELIEKGKKRIKFFSWEKMAKQTLEVYSTCV